MTKQPDPNSARSQRNISPSAKEFTLRVTRFDNRGTPTNPYGYLEFNDFTRLGYAPVIENAPPELTATQGLFDGNLGGNTLKHYTVAILHLQNTLPSHTIKYPLKDHIAQVNSWYRAKAPASITP